MKRILFFILFCGLWTAAAVAAEPTHVYLIGDSTCATKKLDKENPERGWGQMFQPLFDESVIVENHAYNGRSSRSFREEKRWAPIYEKLQPGDYVFIEFGHNDQKIKTERYAGPDVYGENLRRYIRETREKEAIPVLLTPIVRRHFVDGVLIDTHGEYLTACRRIAAEENVAFIDAEKLTREWVSGLGDEASREYFMWVAPGTCPLYPNGREDNTHLNVLGARTLARMLIAEMRNVVPELAKYASPVMIPDLVVAKDGSGDFFTVAEAVAAIPDFCRAQTRLRIMPGTYREKISVPYTKRNVLMEGRGDVTITWNDYASKIGPTGHELGTSGSATVYFGGDNWTLYNITFANTAGRVGQAVAVQCLGDNLRFFTCRFLGNQDTLYLYGHGNRDLETGYLNCWYRFEDCYIEGTTDFIFGSASARFTACEIHSLADSYITAASTCKGAQTGLTFYMCRLTAADGVTKCYLGRPWREYAQTVFIDCELGAHIRPEGWHDWNKPEARKHAFYGEYGSTGPGAAGPRVKWAHRLSRKQADDLTRPLY
ncbi:MAG: pectinesterase family protein [Alistipes senegalensis]|nr:pectinesterase family protein [Bacteroides cellulosilyticus]MCM1352555.1 pectinesterase family protein [Alistipes senegalensis]